MNPAEMVPKWRALPSRLLLMVQADLARQLGRGKSTGLPNGVLLAGEVIHEKVTVTDMRKHGAKKSACAFQWSEGGERKPAV